MVTPLELRMSTLCLFLGFSASASRAAALLLPLLRDLYTAAMAVSVCDIGGRKGMGGAMLVVATCKKVNVPKN